ncbi:arginine deiminase-related protein [Legionella waltersii]|uniref:Amidinotransferase n=2 Tax=Legionella waltersii TaxID=66969 RepID=A0A0W1A4Q6_9GAMM|nr:arginine deiminase-related protein [Legionella waltersii]KTD76325.1 Amidinotransferase [Legionella waltersii]SNV13734.1 Uncharacterized protein conserved in bacteria containing a pentein-type domain [Legionella waltersii]
MSNKRSTVLMVPPEGFQYNHETAKSNSFQSLLMSDQIKQSAMQEFNSMVLQLKASGIEVLLLHQDHSLPDAVFPNNWFSTHINSNGKNVLIIYPMLTPNRQKEVNLEGLLDVLTKANFQVDEIVDLRENNSQVLEGTGSLVLDRENRCLYAALSPRTHSELVMQVANIIDYEPFLFDSIDKNNQPIYHTNVMMSITKHYVIICLDSIIDNIQREALVQSFHRSDKEIIDITLQQVEQMCGNVLELIDERGESQLILSSRAHQHFRAEQLEIIQRYSKLLPIHIPTIEKVGGGSTRCKMAEIIY